MKTTIATAFCLLLAAALPAHADDLDQGTASRFVVAFYKAVQKHDMQTVSSMIDDRADIKVVWTEAQPPQTFTLGKADFLQQLRATWHFASNETYDVRNLSVSKVNGVITVSLDEAETRLLFGNKAGQNNQLQVRMGGDEDNPVITGIYSKTKLW